MYAATLAEAGPLRNVSLISDTLVSDEVTINALRMVSGTTTLGTGARLTFSNSSVLEIGANMTLDPRRAIVIGANTNSIGSKNVISIAPGTVNNEVKAQYNRSHYPAWHYRGEPALPGKHHRDKDHGHLKGNVGATIAAGGRLNLEGFGANTLDLTIASKTGNRGSATAAPL